MSLAEMARALGMDGVNPSGTLGRIEVGSRKPDADFVERIVRLTESEVTAGDMHEARLDWLRAHRPEKFSEPRIPEAAE